MARFSAVALCACAVALSSSSFAGLQPHGPANGSVMQNPAAKQMMSYNLTCQAAFGSGMTPYGPVWNSHDLLITNHGPGTVPAGTTVRWAITDGTNTYAGGYTFAAALPSSQSVVLANVLANPMRARTPCTSLFNANQS